VGIGIVLSRGFISNNSELTIENRKDEQGVIADITLIRSWQNNHLKIK
jgi:hypothetical protein